MVSDPNEPPWSQRIRALANTPTQQYFSRPSNLAFHNLCETLTPPPGLITLLGLGHKYCIERTVPSTTFQEPIDRFLRQIRLRHWVLSNVPNFDENQQEGESYIQNLYVPSTWRPPPVEDGNIECAALSFARKVEHLQVALADTSGRHSNLTPLQHRLMKELKDDTRFIVCLTDKNLGPCIIERMRYIERAHNDHLGDTTTYQRLTKDDAIAFERQTKSTLKQLVEQHKDDLTAAELTYFARSLKLEHRRPQFYLTFKVHKQPLKTRPVVSCVGSFNEVFSKWLDYQMKRLLPLSKTYLRDSQQVLEELAALGPLPLNARLFTADAVSMYTNIDTQHALEVFARWLTEFPDEIPEKFPTKLFLQVLEQVMTRNLFQFDDTYYRQIDGTAMGTSSACMFATLYYALHERLTILTHFGHAMPFFKRFIDDILGVWIGTSTEWEQFKDKLNNFGKLEWEVSDLKTNAIFLDLNISISSKQQIVTKTYEKPMNLFLYIPPTSAHPPGVLKSIVYGNLQRFWRQNTFNSDFQSIVNKFFQRLVARGHSPDAVRAIFMEAAAAIDRNANRQTATSPRRADPFNTLFFHLEYHPRGISRRAIRAIYKETNCETLSGFPRFIVAFSRPRNLRDALMRTTLEEPDGSRASNVFDRLTGVQLGDRVA